MEFREVLQNFLITLVTGVLGVLAAFLVGLAKKGFDWLSAKIDNIKNETHKSKLQSALAILRTTVNDTVTSLQQEFGDDIRESIKNNDGKYTKEDLLALKDKALTIVVSNLNDSIVDILEETYDDIGEIINDLIEVAVRNLKGEKIAETSSTKLLLE